MGGGLPILHFYQFCIFFVCHHDPHSSFIFATSPYSSSFTQRTGPTSIFLFTKPSFLTLSFLGHSSGISISYSSSSHYFRPKIKAVYFYLHTSPSHLFSYYFIPFHLSDLSSLLGLLGLPYFFLYTVFYLIQWSPMESNRVHWNRQSHSSTFPFLDLVDLIDVIFIVSHSYLLHLKSNLFPFSFKVRE